MCKSGFKISTWSLGSISLAVTSPASYLLILNVVLKSLSKLFVLTAKHLIFKTISITSSTTPFIVENSCWTPLILIAIGAAPGRAPKSVLLKALPIVVPNPFSYGSIINLP